MFCLFLSIFLADPMPLDMPRAEAYLVRERGDLRLEDRYDKTDLWLSRTILGRWFDSDGRTFLLARLDTCPPMIDGSGVQTRCEYAAQAVRMKRVRRTGGFPPAFWESVRMLSPCPLAEEPRSPRQLVHGYADIQYWQHPTNYSCIVCTFRPEKTERWYLATWELAEGDDYPRQMTEFEDGFLRKEFLPFVATLPKPLPASPTDEREQLRTDVRHSVAAYENWHYTGAEEFAVVDDLPSRGFIGTLTNDLAVMRAAYAATLPTELDGSNVLCVARIFATRDEYLEALETDGLTNMMWSAAYWSTQRRELVAHLSGRGNDELLKTIRHEAFHQYLSYATAMIPVSPWLNEGYAQYFEDREDENWSLPFELTDEAIDRLATHIPGLLAMNYQQFYDGTDAERMVKYRLAWSIVRFLEKGAENVRLRPFKGLKQRYFRTLIEAKDASKAVSAAFKNQETLELFIVEWKKYWKK